MWVGSCIWFLDVFNFGKYLFEVVDCCTNCVIYSCGFVLIYGEWETILEVRQIFWMFHELFRFLWLKQLV